MLRSSLTWYIGKYTFPDVLSGLEEIRSGTVVIQINEGILTSAFARNATLLADRRVETLGDAFRFWSSLILPKRYIQSLRSCERDVFYTFPYYRSPLTKMFRRGLSRLRQSGVMGRLSVMWEGPGLPKAQAQPLEVSSRERSAARCTSLESRVFGRCCRWARPSSCTW